MTDEEKLGEAEMRVGRRRPQATRGAFASASGRDDLTLRRRKPVDDAIWEWQREQSNQLPVTYNCRGLAVQEDITVAAKGVKQPLKAEDLRRIGNPEYYATGIRRVPPLSPCGDLPFIAGTVLYSAIASLVIYSASAEPEITCRSLPASLFGT